MCYPPYIAALGAALGAAPVAALVAAPTARTLLAAPALVGALFEHSGRLA